MIIKVGGLEPLGPIGVYAYAVSLHMIVIVTARAIPAVTMASAPRHLPLRNNYCGHLPSG